MTCLNCIRNREEIQELNETIRQLKASLSPADLAHKFAVQFGLTTKESRLLAALVEHGLKTKQQLMDALYLGAEDEPDIKIVDVFVCKVRKKMRPHGFKITTIWGHGYSMSDEHREALSFPKAA